jgi:CheY-like chemotaxis protein
MKLRVLVVDDDAGNRELIAAICQRIQSMNIEVFQAANGAAALEIARRERPDLVLLDIMMPGMSGHEVCLRIKNTPELAATRVIMVTAIDDVSDRRQAESACVDSYIVKPFDIQVMRRQLENCLTSLMNVGA